MSDTTPQSVSNGCRKYVKSKIDFNNFNTFINVNKIRKYLIHLLGGVTEEYCERKIDYHTRVERVNAIESVLLMMERCYGMPNDEWIKTAYDYTYARREAAVKNLEELKQQMITTKK